MLRYRLARDFVEYGADVTADVSLQDGGQAAIGFCPLRCTGNWLGALVHLVTRAWHFSPAILGVCAAVHNGPQYAPSR
jgi:hypothetical protein